MSALIILIFLIVVTAGMGVRVVSQGEELIVERLGRYHATLKPGLNVILPYLDRIAYKVPTKDIILQVAQQECITKDNAVILANAITFVKVTDPVKAVYGVSNYEIAISNMVQTALRSIIGTMDLDEALSSREHIKAKLKEAIAGEAQDWGLTVRTVEIQDIKPSASMQNAMEQQAAAERSRKALVTQASGQKEAVILEAEGRLESARRDAEAQVTLSESTAQAIVNVSKAISGQDTAALYLLGEKYVQAMEKLSSSPNSKTILLPADIKDSVGALLGGIAR